MMILSIFCGFQIRRQAPRAFGKFASTIKTILSATISFSQFGLMQAWILRYVIVYFEVFENNSYELSFVIDAVLKLHINQHVERAYTL